MAVIKVDDGRTVKVVERKEEVAKKTDNEVNVDVVRREEVAKVEGTDERVSIPKRKAEVIEVHNGPRGLPGRDGVDGVDGQDGEDGKDGAPGDAGEVFEQMSASAVWNIVHLLDKKPSITVVDSAGTLMEGGDIKYLSNSEIRIEFTHPFSGKAYLN